MATDGQKDFAIIVGINDYTGQDLAPLQGAKNDAQAFVKWRESPTGGAVPPQQVEPYLLLSRKGDRFPRRDDIFDLAEKLLGRAGQGDHRIGRRLYIFLVGHGVAPDLDEVGLMTAEATDDRPSYVPGRLLANLFRGRALFEEVVLCMDCCRDYDRDVPIAEIPFKRRYDAGAAHKVRRLYIFATGFARKSREREFKGEPRGIFSRVLIDGLSGAAVNGAGRITGASLKRYVQKALDELKLGELATQHPQLNPDELQAILDRLKLQGDVQEPKFEPEDEFIVADGLPPKLVAVCVELSEPDKPFEVLDGEGLRPVQFAAQTVAPNVRKLQLPADKTYLLVSLDAQGNWKKRTSVVLEDKEVYATL